MLASWPRVQSGRQRPLFTCLFILYHESAWDSGERCEHHEGPAQDLHDVYTSCFCSLSLLMQDTEIDDQATKRFAIYEVAESRLLRVVKIASCCQECAACLACHTFSEAHEGCACMLDFCSFIITYVFSSPSPILPMCARVFSTPGSCQRRIDGPHGREVSPWVSIARAQPHA